jgi:hypothetical protein
MELWNDGSNRRIFLKNDFSPLLSSTPVLHYSMIPIFHEFFILTIPLKGC